MARAIRGVSEPGVPSLQEFYLTRVILPGVVVSS